MSAGYSGKPLADKIGIKPGHLVVLLHAPAGFERVLGPLPAGARVTTRHVATADVVLLFAERAAALEKEFPGRATALHGGAMLWIAWPKRASKRPTDLTEDVVRRIGLPTGLVDVKVCAIDDTWSGLKFLRRRAPA